MTGRVGGTKPGNRVGGKEGTKKGQDLCQEGVGEQRERGRKDTSKWSERGGREATGQGELPDAGW